MGLTRKEAKIVKTTLLFYSSPASRGTFRD